MLFGNGNVAVVRKVFSYWMLETMDFKSHYCFSIAWGLGGEPIALGSYGSCYMTHFENCPMRRVCFESLIAISSLRHANSRIYAVKNKLNNCYQLIKKRDWKLGLDKFYLQNDLFCLPAVLVKIAYSARNSACRIYPRLLQMRVSNNLNKELRL